MLNSLTISQICTNLSSTGYLQGPPQPHHPGQLIISSSMSMYTVSPSVSLPFVRRKKHLKLNTSFCGSYGGSETSSTPYEQNYLHPYTQKSIHTMRPLLFCIFCISSCSTSADYSLVISLGLDPSKPPGLPVSFCA